MRAVSEDLIADEKSIQNRREEPPNRYHLGGGGRRPDGLQAAKAAGGGHHFVGSNKEMAREFIDAVASVGQGV